MARRAYNEGNVALTFALLLPALLGLAGAGVDFNRYTTAKSKLQAAADSGALAGAREFLLSQTSEALARTRAVSVATSAMRKEFGAEPETPTADADSVAGTVSISVRHSFRPTLFVALVKSPITIDATATAQVSGGADICVIALEETAGDAIKLDDTATLDGRDCAVYANSVDKAGLAVQSAAKLITGFTCTAGGYVGSELNFDPSPLTDCPARRDPIAGRTPPSVGSCDHQDFSVNDYVGPVYPGVYCGGLVVDGASFATFSPGVYVIKDGDFQVKGKARVLGGGVMFYFVGDSARALFEDEARISLTAPVNGPMAGVLMWRDAAASGVDAFEIKSSFVDNLVGTIYLPDASFNVLATGDVAEASAYTAIVARQIVLSSKSKLVLNTNYLSTPVPALEGIRAAGAEVFLRE